MKVKGIAYYQIDTEGLAVHEVTCELKTAGMTEIEVNVIGSEKTEDVPDDWFEDFTFKIEFSGNLHGSIEEFERKTGFEIMEPNLTKR